MRQRRRTGREEPPGTDIDRGPVADPESIARTIVLTKLTTRARSRQELADALAQRGVPHDVATRVLDRFGEVGLVDDAAFAKTWVESRQASRGLSRRALSLELQRKGVDSDVAAESLDGIDETTEYVAARRLVDKKLRSNRKSERSAQWRQLVGLLARRGYSSTLSMRVVAEALSAEETPSGTTEPEPSDSLT